MNRPRPSVLELFDPLSTRDAHSPESDKENTLPDSDFFPHVNHPSPVRLTRRLVEVGDVTVDIRDLGCNDEDVDEDDGTEGGEDDGDDTVGLGAPPSPRTPLEDVTFDREPTPMRSKTYRRKQTASEVGLSNPTPDDYAFAAVINQVSASGATFGGSHAAPAVVICSPDVSPSSSNGDVDALSTSRSTLSLATPTGSLIADTTLAFPTPSEASTSLLVPTTQRDLPLSPSSFNPDQVSSDLHSSFALHMDMTSAEGSFDLLNDKISFLSHGDEESYYIEGVPGSLSGQEDPKETGRSFTVPISSCVHKELSLVTDPAGNLGSPPLQLSEVPREAVNPVDPSVSPAMPLEPPIPSIAPVFVAPPTSKIVPTPALLTSLPEPPALVPALKIVKRQRPDVTTGSETTALPVGTLSSDDGIQSANPPVSVYGRAPRIVPSMFPSVGRYVTGQAPGRVTNIDKEKAATTMKYHKPIAGTTVSGPRRVPVPTQAPPPPPAKAPSQLAHITSGLAIKRPLRVVPPNGSNGSASSPPQLAQTASGLGIKRSLRVIPPNASASSLPRAVGGTSNGAGSRLPMPTSKLATAGGTGIARRKVL